MKHPLSRFFADMNERMQTKVVGMHLEEEFVLTPKLLEAEILSRKREGGNVKGFLYCNPNNPLGVVYPRQLAIDLMDVCKRHKVRVYCHETYSGPQTHFGEPDYMKPRPDSSVQVHFIADEIYALSVFDPSTSFSSVLSLPIEKV